ncbi:Hypothetical predicted protein, partial [Scomber scombrus]
SPRTFENSSILINDHSVILGVLAKNHRNSSSATRTTQEPLESPQNTETSSCIPRTTLRTTVEPWNYLNYL